MACCSLWGSNRAHRTSNQREEGLLITTLQGDQRLPMGSKHQGQGTVWFEEVFVLYETACTLHTLWPVKAWQACSGIPQLLLSSFIVKRVTFSSSCFTRRSAIAAAGPACLSTTLPLPGLNQPAPPHVHKPLFPVSLYCVTRTAGAGPRRCGSSGSSRAARSARS